MVNKINPYRSQEYCQEVFRDRVFERFSRFAPNDFNTANLVAVAPGHVRSKDGSQHWYQCWYCCHWSSIGQVMVGEFFCKKCVREERDELLRRQKERERFEAFLRGRRPTLKLKLAYLIQTMKGR